MSYPTLLNFVISYKPPRLEHSTYLEHLDEMLAHMKLINPTYVIGDLNMDLLSKAGEPLTALMNTYGFVNLVQNQPEHKRFPLAGYREQQVPLLMFATRMPQNCVLALVLSNVHFLIMI